MNGNVFHNRLPFFKFLHYSHLYQKEIKIPRRRTWIFLSLRGGMAVEYGNEFDLVRCPCSLLLSRMLV